MPTKRRRTVSCLRCREVKPGCPDSHLCHDCRRWLGLPNIPLHKSHVGYDVPKTYPMPPMLRKHLAA